MEQEEQLIIRGAIAALKDVVFIIDSKPDMPLSVMSIIISVKISELESQIKCATATAVK